MSATGVRFSLSPPPRLNWSCWASGKPSRLESGQVREIGFERSTRFGSSGFSELRRVAGTVTGQFAKLEPVARVPSRFDSCTLR